MRIVVCPNCGFQICVGCSKNHARDDRNDLLWYSDGFPDKSVLGMIIGSLDNARILVLAGGDPGSPTPDN